jgi:hypothetical protein
LFCWSQAWSFHAFRKRNARQGNLPDFKTHFDQRLLPFGAQDFSEEQLRDYKEYQAKEKAAIEERVKRRATMEQERRALRVSAEDVVAKVAGRAKRRGRACPALRPRPALTAHTFRDLHML